MATKKKTQTRSVSCFLPVYNLGFHKCLDGELRIEDVTFVSAKKIPRVWKRLGLAKPVRDYKAGYPARQLFHEAPTYAFVISRRTSLDGTYEDEYSKAREALHILASSFLGKQERPRPKPSLRPGPPNRIFQDTLAFVRGSNDFSIGNSFHTRQRPTGLTPPWQRDASAYGFFDLLSVLAARRGKVNRGWQETLRRTALLAGRSYLARDLPEALMLDMIGMETLLTRQGDKFPDVLINRVAALLGWVTDDDIEPWQDRISALYQVRCSYVHDGQTSNATPGHLALGDTLLSNLLLNIARNVRIFKTKDAVIQFAEETMARRTLQLPLKRKGQRLRFLQRHLTDAELNDVGEWSE